MSFRLSLPSAWPQQAFTVLTQVPFGTGRYFSSSGTGLTRC